MKYQTEVSGQPYKKIHNLSGLIADVEQTGFTVDDELKAMAYQISDWEASSRYNDEFKVSIAEIQKAIDLYEKLEEHILSWLDINLSCSSDLTLGDGLS